MVKKTLLTIFILFLAFSCTTAKFSNLSYIIEDNEEVVLGEFKTVLNIPEFAGFPGGANIANISVENASTPVQDAIEAEIKALGGSKAINVTIEQRVEIVDYIFSTITAGLYVPVTIVITGTVVE